MKNEVREMSKRIRGQRGRTQTKDDVKRRKESDYVI